MKRNVLIDIDNTLTFLDYTLRSLEDFYDVPRKEVSEITSFDLGSVYGIPKEEHASFWIEREEDIVQNSVLNQKVYKQIEEDLTKHDDIYIVTARAPELERLTLQWLKSNDIKFNQLYCIGKEETKDQWSKRKGIVFDRVVEDNPVYLKAINGNKHTTVIDYPYNREIISDVRLIP